MRELAMKPVSLRGKNLVSYLVYIMTLWQYYGGLKFSVIEIKLNKLSESLTFTLLFLIYSTLSFGMETKTTVTYLVPYKPMR